MNTIEILAQQQYNEVLNLEIAYSKLYNAYITDNVSNMQTAILYFNNKFSHLKTKRQAECDKVFYANGIYDFSHDGNLYTLSFKELQMNTNGCMNTALNELDKLNYYQSNSTYALKTLYGPNRTFQETEVLDAKDGNSLMVADLLKVSKYAVELAKAIAPDNKDFDKASAAISVFQGIDLALNNSPDDKPINKMLHLATDFLSTVVMSNVKERESKQAVSVGSVLVGLAIDFFCKK